MSSPCAILEELQEKKSVNSEQLDSSHTGQRSMVMP